jgi:DNA excision repair protein ERCC-5
LEAFYSFSERFAKIRSKRVKKAVKGITGKLPSDLIDDSAENMSKGMKNGRGSSVDPEDDKLETSKETEESLAGRKKSKAKESTKRKNDRDTVAKQHTKKKKINDVSSSTPAASEVENLQPCMQTEEGQHDGKGLTRNKSGSERGRGRGKGKGVGVTRGKAKRTRFQSSETEASSDSSDIENHDSTLPEVVRRVRFILNRFFLLESMKYDAPSSFFNFSVENLLLFLLVNKKDIIRSFNPVNFMKCLLSLSMFK